MEAFLPILVVVAVAACCGFPLLLLRLKGVTERRTGSGRRPAAVDDALHWDMSAGELTHRPGEHAGERE